MFVGREKELRTLERLYQKEAFEFVVVYGRRRVGKTTLLNEFIKDKKLVFYSCLDSNEKQNLDLFSSAVVTAITGTDARFSFQSYQDALDYVLEQAMKERLILVIDEYPYLANCYPGISSLLAAMIDHKFLNSKLMLILCGSSLSFMENQVLGYQSPLYGRQTAQMKILPFQFSECINYYQNFDKQELALAYGISGGIPLYMSKINDSKSMEENIKDNFFEISAYLYEEPENLIKQECREPMQYNAIIRSIATGSSKISEIAGTSGIGDNSTVSNYISKLLSLGIVEKEYPYKTASTRKTIYKLADTMFQFWYRFIPSNRSLIEQGAAERVYRKIEEQIPAYMGFVFEEICKQYLWKKNLEGNAPIEFTDMGRWWGTDKTTRTQTEIDIIADNEQDEAIFAECKWRNEDVGQAELSSLQHKSTLFHHRRKVLMLFSKTGFTEGCVKLAKELGEVYLIKYEEMEF